MKFKIVLLLLLAILLIPGLTQAKNLRIISAAPSITEILYALGAQDMVVGVSSYCDYPEVVKHKEKIGTFSKANIEKIISLKPDIVFTTGLEQASLIKQLDDFAIKNITIDPKNPEELYRKIIKISTILGIPKEGESLVKNLKMGVLEIKRKIPKGKKPKVLLEIWGNPLMVAGEDSFVGELIKLAGGENIAYDTPRPYSRFSPELVIKRNPDCIILGHTQKDALSNMYKRVGWSNINAVKSKKIYDDIDPNLILRPGPRFVIGISKIYERLYEK